MLTLICGLPNAGKTTYSQQFDNVIHLDSMWYQSVKKRVGQAEDAVVEGCYCKRSLRVELLKAATGKKTCIFLDTPESECFRRAGKRGNTGSVLQHVKMLEPPRYDEGWDEIIILHLPTT
jgi:predicted kinase